jgi:hypothetical protein
MEDVVIRSTSLKDLPASREQQSPRQSPPKSSASTSHESYIERLWRTRGSMRVAVLAVLVVLAALAVHTLVDGTVTTAAIDLSRTQIALLRAVYPAAVLVVLWTLASDQRGPPGRSGGSSGSRHHRA